MKAAVLTSCVVFLNMVSCGGSSPKSESASVSTQEANRVHELKGKFGTYEATLSASVPVEQGSAISKDGWLVLSFNALQDGGASLLLSNYGLVHEDISLTLKKGPGAMIIDPSLKVMKTGNITGIRSYPTGAHGSRSDIEIPTLTETDLSYSCGPQGAMCRVDLPVTPDSLLSTDDDTYVCGPQGMRCPGRIDRTPAPVPTVCGPQGAHC